jgi:Holliday junction resolvase
LDSKQSRANKRKGATWETDLVEYFREKEFNPVERLRLSGTSDEGDLWLWAPDIQSFIVVEAKNEKSFKLGPWVEEASIEVRNWIKKRKSTPAIPIVIAKRRQHGIGKSFVIMELDTFTEVLKWKH